MTVETKRNSWTKKVTTSKVVVGDVKVSGKDSGVVVVDLTGDKPSYKFVKAALPACKVDLADKDHTSWPRAIDEAVAELKKKSKAIGALAD